MPRGRSHRRVEVAEVIVEEERRPLSPLVSQSTKARSRSTGRHERYSIPRKPVRQQRSQETIYRRALSPRYRYVHGPAASIQADPAETSYPRRIPVHFVEEDIYESAPPSRASHNVHEEAPWQSVPLREYSIDERETASSSRSQEAAQRRRRERSLPNDGIEPPLPPWQQPHIIHPRPGDETIVVTERYVYRPRKASQVEEERRIQERVDKIMLDGRRRTTEFAAEDEASKYYHDDWAHEESARRNESIRRRVPRQRGYRREMHQDSELADSEDSLDFVRTGMRADELYQCNKLIKGRSPAPTQPTSSSFTSNFGHFIAPSRHLARPTTIPRQFRQRSRTPHQNRRESQSRTEKYLTEQK